MRATVAAARYPDFFAAGTGSAGGGHSYPSLDPTAGASTSTTIGCAEQIWYAVRQKVDEIIATPNGGGIGLVAAGQIACLLTNPLLRGGHRRAALDRVAARIADPDEIPWFAGLLLQALAGIGPSRLPLPTDVVDWAVTRLCAVSPGADVHNSLTAATAVMSSNAAGLLTYRHLTQIAAFAGQETALPFPRAREALLCLVAAHQACPEALLRALSMHSHEPIRQAAAGNPGCPDDARVAAALLDLAARHPEYVS